MKTRRLHPWDLSRKEAIDVQRGSVAGFASYPSKSG